MISAVILVKNQAEQLKRCIQSLTWCDEVVVIDDHSTDGSDEVARKLGARVYRRALDGDFSVQRNFALDKAKYEWVFFVDADEVVTKELEEEIYQLTSQFLTSANGFLIPRKDILWGKELRFGETGHINLLRLGRKEKGHWEGRVHEEWKVLGEVVRLQHPLLHYPHPTIREFLSEINTYSTLRAKELHQKKTTVSLTAIIAYPIGKFFLNYFFKLGFLDGVRGMIVALMMSFHSFLVRGKLWQLRQKKAKYEFGY